MKLWNAAHLFGLTGVLFALVGCGSSSDSKEKQAADFYAEKLHTTDQSTCNGKGKFYDNYAGACGQENLATWECTRAGLVEYLDKRDAKGVADVFDAAVLEVLDQKMAQGFVMHQCGDTATGAAAVILVKKGMSGDSATIEVGRLDFTDPTSL